MTSHKTDDTPRTNKIDVSCIGNDEMAYTALAMCRTLERELAASVSYAGELAALLRDAQDAMLDPYKSVGVQRRIDAVLAKNPSRPDPMPASSGDATKAMLAALSKKFTPPASCPVSTTCERERECSGMCPVRDRPAKPSNVSCEGSGKVKVDVDALLESPRVQEQIAAVRELEKSGYLGFDPRPELNGVGNAFEGVKFESGTGWVKLHCISAEAAKLIRDFIGEKR